MPPRPGLKQVPTIAQVIPGAYVHIVLKQDQPTGRTVQGVVQAVLTRGNHPRGIKVRLNDGRVGRVQTMGDSKGASASAAFSPQGIQHRGEEFAAAFAARQETQSAGYEISGEEAPIEQIGLDAYIRPAKPKQKKRNGIKGGTNAQPVEMVESSAPPASPKATMTCPVCGDFEGDEAAVSHHVASHFDT